MSDDSTVCAYCGEPGLAGNEEPEHAIPAAINGRFATRAVCGPCNRWAGQEIDQPWLHDPFVLDVRFHARIPDRRGKLLQRSPLLAGVTEDGRRIELGSDGTPELRNSVVRRDPESGEVQVLAPDQATLDKLLERERKKAEAEAEGRSWTAGAQSAMSDRPQLSATGIVWPGRWERMAAKASLALLAEVQPAAWRRSPSAVLLRARMRDMSRSQILLSSSEAVRSFAASPATAISLTTVSGTAILNASLLGVFTVPFALADDLKRIDLAWVSDPVDPSRSCSGTLAEVVYQRHRALGYL